MNMLTGFRRATLMALLLTASYPLGASAVDGVSAIATPGSGTLTMCRSWMLFLTCRDYNNVTLPIRIAVGDSLPLTFGSNPKDYIFPVARIARQGDNCVVLSEAAGDPGKVNKIAVASCRDAPGSH